MNKEIDVEKIRGLLEKIKLYFVGKSLKGRIQMLDIVDQILALLPPPCSECGGSGFDHPFENASQPVLDPCPRCKGTGIEPVCQALHQNGTGQAPAGEVEKCIKELRELADLPAEQRTRTGWTGADERAMNQACTHLEAQAKQIKQLKNEMEQRVDDNWNNGYEIGRNEQLAKIEQLEAENRWIPPDNPPDNIDWEKKVLVLECESETPAIMTMAEVFLNEGSDVEYWKPIILPDLQEKGE